MWPFKRKMCIIKTTIDAVELIFSYNNFLTLMITLPQRPTERDKPFMMEDQQRPGVLKQFFL